MRDGWIETNLEGIAEYINGYPFKPADLGENGVPVIRIKQLLDPNEPVDRTETETPERCLLRDGDIVFSWSGTLAVRIWNRGPAKLNQHLFRVVEKNGVCKGIIPLILDHAIKELEDKSHGTTMKHITKQTLLPHKVLLPPLPEQKRIVDLISSVDCYIEALQQQLESAKRSRNAVLHELLTAGGDDWVESTLGEIANWGSGGTPKADNPDFYNGEIPWCVIGDLTESEVWETEKRITNLGLSNSSAKVIDPGSVLLAMYGASIGRTGISAIPMATNQAIAFARCHSNLALPKYLLAYLQTQKTKFVKMGQGAAQPNISQTIIKAWPINLPPIPYQDHLVSTMEVFDATLFTLQSSINASKLLRSSLLSDLLSGEHEIPPSYDKVMGAA
jgi:type I restriction enzyme S subunit